MEKDEVRCPTGPSNSASLKLFCPEELSIQIAPNYFVVLNVDVTGKPTNRIEVAWDQDGIIGVEFVDLTPKEYEALPIQPEPTGSGFDLGLSKESKKDPNLRVMASECAIHGLTRITGHIWGE